MRVRCFRFVAVATGAVSIPMLTAAPAAAQSSVADTTGGAWDRAEEVGASR